MMAMIQEYHTEIGWPYKDLQDVYYEDQLIRHREYCLALFMEVAELANAAQWKPWGKDKPVDTENLKEELADIFYFLTGMCTIWNIEPPQLESKIVEKLAENRRRIQSGYMKTNL